MPKEYVVYQTVDYSKSGNIFYQNSLNRFCRKLKTGVNFEFSLSECRNLHVVFEMVQNSLSYL